MVQGDGSGRSHSHMATTTMIAVPVAAIHSFGAVRNITTAQALIIVVASPFARRLTAPCACQSRIIGPNRRSASSRACSRCDPRAAAKADSSTNGTVGSPGTTTPITPARPPERRSLPTFFAE